jgi:hypothetical protein
MPDFFIPAFFTLTFIGFIMVGIFIAIKKANGTNHLRLLGETLNVQVVGGDPFFKSIRWLSFIRRPTRVSGDYRGNSLEVWHFTRGSGKNSSPYIGVRLGLNNQRDLSFKFYKEGLFSKIGKTFGMQDVPVGDADFDKTFVVKCSDPDFIRTALLPEIKEKFYHAFVHHGAKGTLQLEGNKLYYEEGGRIRSEAIRSRFVSVIDLCADLRETVHVYNDIA